MKLPDDFIRDFTAAAGHKDRIVSLLGKAGALASRGAEGAAERVLFDMPQGTLSPVEYALERLASDEERDEFSAALKGAAVAEDVIAWVERLAEFAPIAYLASRAKYGRFGFENYPTAIESAPYLMLRLGSSTPCLRVTVKSADQPVFTFSADLDQVLGLSVKLAENVGKMLGDLRTTKIPLPADVAQEVRERLGGLMGTVQTICTETEIKFEDILLDSKQQLRESSPPPSNSST